MAGAEKAKDAILDAKQQTEARREEIFSWSLAAWLVPAVGVAGLALNNIDLSEMQASANHRDTIKTIRIENKRKNELHQVAIDQKTALRHIEARRRINTLVCEPVSLLRNGEVTETGKVPAGAEGILAPLNSDGSPVFPNGTCVIDAAGNTALIDGIEVVEILPPPPELREEIEAESQLDQTEESAEEPDTLEAKK